MAGFLDVKGRVCNTRNNVTDAAGYAIPPLASNLAQGQIAVHTSDTDPCLFFKTTSEKIVKIPTEAVLVKALTDILGNSAADLDTLRELIAQFEGSANDILPMLVALTDRVSAAETALGNKANSSVVNAHIQNTSNPHEVTASQVGLSNVLNKEQLGKNETAVASKLLAPTGEYEDANFIGSNSGTAGLHATNIVASTSTNYPNSVGVALTYMRAPRVVTDSNRKLQLFSACTNNELHCRFGAGNGTEMVHSSWFKMWHSGNSNNADVSWTAQNLYVHGDRKPYAAMVTTSGTTNQALFGYTDRALGSLRAFVRVGDDVLKFNPLAGSGREYDIYHAGNSNKSDVEWTAKNLKLPTDNSFITFYNNLFIGKESGRGLVLGAGTLNNIKVKVDTNYYDLYNSGNSNLPTVNWTAKFMYARGYYGSSTPENSIGQPLDLIGSNGNGTDKTGGGTYIYAGRGTGTAAGGVIGFFTSPKGSTSGSSVNAAIRRMTITQDGNIGVGTETPVDKFHIANGGMTISNGAAYRIQDTTGRAARVISLSGSNDVYMGCVDSNLRDLYITHNGQNTIRFSGNNPYGTISVLDGKIGFGTNNPTDRVHAVGNIRATEKVIAGGNVESSGSGIFTGDIISKKLGAVVFAANDQAAGSATRLNDLQDVKLPANLSAKMIMAYDPAQVNADGTTGGYTFMPAVGVGTGKVVADDIDSLPDLNLIGSTYVAASDKRLKDNIRPLVGATNILLNFAAKEYEWNEEGKRLGLTDPRAYGLIAQEAADLKDIVDIVRPMGNSDYLGVDYVKIVPILIAGFQELHNELGIVNRKIDSIRTRTNKSFGMEDANAKKITTLEAEVAELKRLIRN